MTELIITLLITISFFACFTISGYRTKEAWDKWRHFTIHNLTTKTYIYPEKTASDVFNNLMDIKPFNDSIKVFQALYQDRWIPKGGWKGQVFGLPVKNELSGKLSAWRFTVKEEGNGALFLVYTNDDISTLRIGQNVTVWGKIQSWALGVLLVNEATFTQN